MSQEQIQAYVEQVRSAPADQLLSGILSELLEVAQIKLGRGDARLFIDSGAALLEQARPYVPAELAGNVDRMLGDLRLAQVEAESGSQTTDEPGDLSEAPTAGSAAAQPTAGSAAAQPTAGSAAAQPADQGATNTRSPGQSTAQPTGQPVRQPTEQPAEQQKPAGGASKLWIPGRDF